MTPRNDDQNDQALELATAPQQGYRRCVGLWILNRDGLLFTAKRRDAKAAGWQAPQGGIDPGESAMEAALREMKEEIGVDDAELLAESAFWRAYDLPPAIRKKVWGGRYKGQTQKWVALLYRGEDRAIDLETDDPEFSVWRWSDPARAAQDVVAFKRSVYQSVQEEFHDLPATVRAR